MNGKKPPTPRSAPALPAEQPWARLLPTEVIWRSARLDEPAEDLHPQEQMAMARAVTKRRHEFAIGRQCARAALQALRGAAEPVPAGADRAPVWPSGVVGSITHNDCFAAAAVAHASHIAGLGIDVDTVERFSDDLAPSLCTPAEIERWLSGQAPPQRRRRLAAIFAIKEAFYKAQYPITGAWLGFEDVEVTPQAAAERSADEVLACGVVEGVELRVIRAAQPGSQKPPRACEGLFNRPWQGHLLLDERYVWASVVLRRDAAC